MSPHASSLGANLLGILSDNSDEVVLQCLSVLAKILNSTHNEGKLILNCVNLLNSASHFHFFALSRFEGL